VIEARGWKLDARTSNSDQSLISSFQLLASNLNHLLVFLTKAINFALLFFKSVRKQGVKPGFHG
jgi:hypothetical protein